MAAPTTNWAGNIRYSAERFHEPSSVDELRAVVAAGRPVRAVGSGHSFNDVADCPGDLVSLAALPRAMDLDTARATVTISGGVRYGELATHLHAAGYALPNLASLPHISVVGACATGTHGSGDRIGGLGTAVSALDLVTADGSLVTLSRDGDPDRFPGAVVGLGALGVVTGLTLDVVPTFDVRQDVYDNLPGRRFRDHWAEIFAAAYSVSVFTDWTGPDLTMVWLKRRVDGEDGWTAPPVWQGATRADGPRHPVPGLSPVHCTEQLGVPGPWHTRLPHFRLGFTPSSGAELQSEYLVPRHLGVDAFAALDRIRDRIAPVVQICEIRTVAGDDLWLSPSHGRDSMAFHFTWTDDAAAVRPVVAAVEEQLAPFDPRPHWGKVFGTDPAAVTAAYGRMPDFARLRDGLDPGGSFRTDFVDRYVPAAS